MRNALLVAPLVLAAGLMSACQSLSPSMEEEMAEENVAALTGSEIEETLRGNTLHRTGSRAGVEWQWAGHYRADGTMTGRAWWGSGEQVAEGRWSVEGDRFCREWSNSWGGGDRGCYRLYRQGDRLTMIKVSGSGDEEGRSYILSGNPYDV
jgi:hypothetical protein